MPFVPLLRKTAVPHTSRTEELPMLAAAARQTSRWPSGGSASPTAPKS